MSTRTRPYQEGFTVGELDPKMVARVGVEQYYQGAAELTNVYHQPTGAVTRRWGLKHVADIPALGDAVRLAAFEFSESENYLLVFTHRNVAVVRGPGDWPSADGVQEDELEQNLYVPFYDRDKIDSLSFTQSADTMIVVHPDVPPQIIVRDTTQPVGGQFSIADAPLSSIPRHDFNDDNSPSSTDAEQTLTFLGAWINSVSGFKLTLEGIESGPILYTENTTDLANLMTDALRFLGPEEFEGIRVLYDEGPDEVTKERYRVLFKGVSGKREFNAITPRPLANAPNAQIEVFVVEPGDTSREFVWSDVYAVRSPNALEGPGRGWPATVQLYENRLWFGGSRSRPATIWSSVTADFFNFNPGTAQDSEAIDVTLQTDKLDAIRHIVPGRHLQVYTLTGEFYTPEVPTTPTNIALSRQTSVGSNTAVPVALDGASFFVDREGRGLRQFLYSFGEDAYTQEDLAVLSAHLFQDPEDLAILQTTEGDYIFVTMAGGYIAVLNSNRHQEIASWTRFTTEGVFRRCEAAGRSMYCVVDRGGGRSLERFDSGYLTDGAEKATGVDQTRWDVPARFTGTTLDVVTERGDVYLATCTNGKRLASGNELAVDLFEVAVPNFCENKNVVGHGYRAGVIVPLLSTSLTD